MAGDPKEVARAHLADAGVEELPEDWDVVTLGDLFTADRGISVGVMYPGDHVPDGVPLIKAGDLNGSIINPHPNFRISKNKHHEYRRTALEGGELLMTLVGKVGQCAVVSPRMAGWNAARAVAVMRLAEPSDTHFVQQCLLSRPLQHLMDVWCNTTVQATLNLKEIRQLPLPWPPKKSRDAIAAFGKSLDDKIELNRRMNATLEAMARALFQSWFVDFDPVRAKLDGRQPAALDPATAALFPEHLEDSPLGHIPKGWKVIGLPEVIDFLEGPGLRNWQYRDEGMKFLNIRCIGDGDLDIAKANCISLEEFEKTYRHFALQEDDIVISTSGTLGRLAIVRADHLPVMLNTSIIRMRGRGAVGLGYAWGFLQSEYFLAEMFALAAGSVQLNFGPMHLRQISILRPPDGILEGFERAVQPLLRKCLQLRKESRTLATLRDTLLPKLLSGELSLAEVGEEVLA